MVAGKRKPRFSQRDTGFCFFVGKTTGTLRKRVAVELFGRDGTFYKLYLGRLQIAFFSVSNEHQEQGAKARNSRLLQA